MCGLGSVPVIEKEQVHETRQSWNVTAAERICSHEVDVVGNEHEIAGTKSAIYPTISRLEPSCDLGQKGALPVPGNMVVAARLPALRGNQQWPSAGSAAGVRMVLWPRG